jgi:hypothetical protein
MKAGDTPAVRLLPYAAFTELSLRAQRSNLVPLSTRLVEIASSLRSSQ